MVLNREKRVLRAGKARQRLDDADLDTTPALCGKIFH